MKKILILTTAHPLDDPRIFYKEAISIKKIFEDVSFIVPDEAEKEFVKNGIRIIPIPKAKKRSNRVLLLQYHVFKIIKKNKFDVIHFHDPELILLAYIIKKFYNKKIVYDVHENVTASIEVRNWIPTSLKGVVKYIFSIIEKKLIRDFDAIILAEKSYAKYYRENSVKILNYPLVVKIDSEIMEKSFDQKINFVYAGSITEIRGIWQILISFKNIIRLYPDSMLYLIGRVNSEDLKKKVDDFIKENNLLNSVQMFGGLPLSQMYEILKKCHIGYVLTKPVIHHSEKLPGKIFDYMIFGIPVVATNYPIYDRYLIEENTGIMVNYDDIKEISVSITDLMKDRKRLKIMSENGVKACFEKWNWKNEEAKLHKLYKNLAAS